MPLPEFTPQEKQAYIAQARDVARELAVPHGPRLQLAPYTEDYVEFPHRHPEAVYDTGNPMTPAELVHVAKNINSGYPAMEETFAGEHNTAAIIDTSIDLLRAGHNITVTTPHGEITDIALAHEAVAHQIYKKDDTLELQRSIWVSKMLAEVDYVFTEAEMADPAQRRQDGMTILKYVYDHILLTWPRSESAQEIVGRLPDSMVRYQNALAKHSYSRLLGRGALLTAMSMTGTTRILPDETGRYTISKVNNATIDLLTIGNTPETADQTDGKHTYVLPLAMEIDDGRQYMKFSQAPVALTSHGQAHQLMQTMAATMADAFPDKTYAYAGADG
jgi:hypothetical protein